MLSARYLEKTKSALSTPRQVKDENEVKQTVPALQPVARIVLGGGNVFDARPFAFIFPLPDGTLIRLDFNDDNTLDYDNATAVPGTHPAAKAYAENPDQEIKIAYTKEGGLGPRANPADVEKLKERLEADSKRYHQEQANERRLKL